MMADLIDRGILIDHIMESDPDWCVKPIRPIFDFINGMPSADIDLSDFSDRLWAAAYERGKAEAVRHGHWIYTPTNILGYVCSECGKAMCRFNYCPHCGAKMDEVE